MMTSSASFASIAFHRTGPSGGETVAAATAPVAHDFGTTRAGEAVQLFALTNARGLRATITNYGGVVTSLLTPDRNGQFGDVVLGFNTLAEYERDAPDHSPYFGALIGRFANRIRGGRFSLDRFHFQLTRNHGSHHVHGGIRGFDKAVWEAEPGASAMGQTLKLTHLSPDGAEGYPGNLHVTVIYTLTDANELRLDYAATTDRPTPLNLTNHSYFNLALGHAPDVLTHQLMIPAEFWLETDADGVPTGRFRPVQGTNLDFRRPHAVGEPAGFPSGGYDHTYALAPPPTLHGAPVLRLAAVLDEPLTGRRLRVLTDQPGLQLYTANSLTGRLVGKGGVVYGRHAGLCLETQHFPDSPNQAAFPRTLLHPGETFRSTTIYQFSTLPDLAF